MLRILFVCHGNICRSPMCEFIMKDLVRKAQCGDEFEIASAATTSEEIWNGTGNPVYPPARRVLMEHGIGIPGNELGVAAKRACLLKRSDYAHYDRIIGMDAENMQDMQRILGGDPYRKLSLLMNYTSRPGEVSDPWYTRDFNATWRDAYEGCRGLLDACRKKEGKI